MPTIIIILYRRAVYDARHVRYAFRQTSFDNNNVVTADSSDRLSHLGEGVRKVRDVLLSFIIINTRHRTRRLL